ncbi:MAG: porphobilinogen synthase [Candidatus Omnitrophica bacterium]|nr:porphobilinogen synthase [Candidatus Omnitrophota bacterium]
MQIVKLREQRKTQEIRDKVAEARLKPRDLILPYFVVGGENKRDPIKSMPGIFHLSIDNLLKDLETLQGLERILLFGIAGAKDEIGSESFREDSIVQKAVRAIKKNFKDLIVITDVCLCGYTSHGHCGIVKDREIIDNDATLEVLAKIALSHAASGADIVAPSAMMDGQVAAIREVLDSNGFNKVRILGYSAKYASGFYGPFREALDSTPQFGDRKTYQMDYRNSDEALKEIAQDIKEGADIVMVKPALSYLDIIAKAKLTFNIPIAAYSVSGEYAMIKEYSKSKKEEDQLALEVLTSIKRAGADFIITYWAKEALEWIQ